MCCVVGVVCCFLCGLYFLCDLCWLFGNLLVVVC